MLLMLDRVLLLQFILNSKSTNHSDDNKTIKKRAMMTCFTEYFF